MNGKAFFSCTILLAFLAIEIGFLESAEKMQAVEQQAMASAFESEQVFFARTLIEENSDNAVRQGLKQGLALGLEKEEVKAAVNARVLALFRAVEQECCEGVSVEFSPESKSLFFLSENSSVILTKAFGQSLEAEYCFTGGLKKANQARALVFGKRTASEFRIPAGYCVREKVVS